MVGWALADQPADRASRSVMDEIQENARRAAVLIGHPVAQLGIGNRAGMANMRGPVRGTRKWLSPDALQVPPERRPRRPAHHRRATRPASSSTGA